MAQQTQESLLPRSLPSFENFRIHAFNHPTRYVGGDFYDFLQLDFGRMDGSFGGCLRQGDARRPAEFDGIGRSQPGIPLRTQPPEVLNRINRLLCEKSLPFQFVTLFLFLQRPDGVGQFISAGHNAAYLFRSAGGKIEELAPDAGVLGMFDSSSYQSREFHLDKGDILVVYSDGLTDAENPRGEMFGETRLLEIIRREGPSGSPVMEQSFLKAIQEFTQGHAPNRRHHLRDRRKVSVIPPVP